MWKTLTRRRNWITTGAALLAATAFQPMSCNITVSPELLDSLVGSDGLGSLSGLLEFGGNGADGQFSHMTASGTQNGGDGDSFDMGHQQDSTNPGQTPGGGQNGRRGDRGGGTRP